MRIRRCASRVLGSSASAPALPRFELPPPSPPPAHESRAGFVAASATCSSCSSSLEPCNLSVSPWDLMDQLDYLDPQAEKIFLETYSVAVAWRASWLFQPIMCVTGSIKKEEEQLEEDMAVDVVDGVMFGLRVCKKKAVRKKNRMNPNMNKEKIKAEGVTNTTTGRGTPVWTCKKNIGGKTWFCRRPASQPDSFCSYHSDQKPKRKRDAGVGEGFLYYTGFGSRSKRHRVSSSSSDAVPGPPPAGQKEEATPEEEKHIDSAAGQAQADGEDHHEAAPPVHVDEPMRDDGTAAMIAGDEESSDEDLYDIKPKSPLKKRWKKPVKARSLKSLMY